MADEQETGGGFLPTGLLSPPASSVVSNQSVPLPQPRSRPLRLGSAKETQFINFVDDSLLRISRKFALRDTSRDAVRKIHFTASQERLSETIPEGYTSFNQAARDIERLLEIVWVSGTPTLQVSYLLSLALLVLNYIAEFPPAPQRTFRLLHKLDHSFASLIRGQDIDTGTILPGLGPGKSITGTDKVRIKSLIERTRVTIVGIMDEGLDPDDGSDLSENEDVNKDWEHDVSMQVARVYDHTLVELGDSLDGPAIGIGNSQQLIRSNE